MSSDDTEGPEFQADSRSPRDQADVHREVRAKIREVRSSLDDMVGSHLSGPFMWMRRVVSSLADAVEILNDRYLRRDAVAGRERHPVPSPHRPSRAEVEALIRAVGRDPVIHEMVDIIMFWFCPEEPCPVCPLGGAGEEPRLGGPRDYAKTRGLVTDPDFVRRVDAAAREVLGRPADTLELIARAMREP